MPSTSKLGFPGCRRGRDRAYSGSPRIWYPMFVCPPSRVEPKRRAACGVPAGRPRRVSFDHTAAEFEQTGYGRRISTPNISPLTSAAANIIRCAFPRSPPSCRGARRTKHSSVTYLFRASHLATANALIGWGGGRTPASCRYHADCAPVRCTANSTEERHGQGTGSR